MLNYSVAELRINNIEHNNILVEKSQNMYTFVSCNGQDDT